MPLLQEAFPILNLGLNDEVVEGLSRKTGRPRFAWDSYRRFVQMYGDVVLGMKPVNKAVREFATLAFREVGITLCWEGQGVDEKGPLWLRRSV